MAGLDLGEPASSDWLLEEVVPCTAVLLPGGTVPADPVLPPAPDPLTDGPAAAPPTPPVLWAADDDAEEDDEDEEAPAVMDMSTPPTATAPTTAAGSITRRRNLDRVVTRLSIPS